ncbi:recombinase family protein [Nocardia sp. NPDC049190]|uniref:recombinase family protein n=1 Tax=Nocardia sp. NPDC049190 TaxID=3155650 RepID=UPI0033C3BE8C
MPCTPPVLRWRTCSSKRVSGKLSSRPQLDALLAKLQPGDQVVVTRLRRIGRTHARHRLRRAGTGHRHLHPGRTVDLPLLRRLAEYDRELIVEGTLDGLAAAKARGRVGGRPRALSKLQLDQAQRMYDEGNLTIDQIADRSLHPLPAARCP